MLLVRSAVAGPSRHLKAKGQQTGALSVGEETEVAKAFVVSIRFMIISHAS